MANSEIKSFLSNAAVYSVGSILLEAASIVLLPLYLSYLSPEEYGMLEILNRVGTFIVIGLMANGIRMATLTFYQQSKCEMEREQVTATVVFALLVVTSVGIPVSIASNPWINLWLGFSRPNILAMGMITVLLECLIIVPLALMQARIQAIQYVSVSCAMFLARVALIIGLVSTLKLGLWGVLIARVLVASAFGITLNMLELRNADFNVDYRTLSRVVSFAMPFLPSGFLSFFINYGDRFFLLKQVGEREVGVYSLSYRMATVVSSFAFIPLYKVWSAKMYTAAERIDASSVFGIMFTRLMASIIFIGLGVSLFAGEALIRLGGTEYLQAIEYLPPLILSVLFMSASDLMDSGFYITRKTKYKPFIFLVTGVVIYVMYVVLIPRFGSAGAAWATLIAYVVQAVLTWRITQKVFYVKYEWWRLMLIAGTAIGVWLVSRASFGGDLQIIVNAALMMGWCICASLAAKKQEREFAVNQVRRGLAVLRLRTGFDRSDNP